MAKPSPKKKSNTAFLAVILVVLVAGGAGIWTAMKNSKPTPIELAPGTPLPQAQGYLYGDPNAPITIIEFADFECPGCGQFATVQEPDLRKRVFDAGLANFRFYDFPLTSIHRNTLAAHLAASCANEQGKFWEYHDLLFEGQYDWNSQAASNPRKIFDGYVTKLGLDAAKFGECYDSQRNLAQIQANAAAGSERGVNSTPTIIIGNKVYSPAPTADQLKQIVDSIRATLPATTPAPATDTTKK
ncbi:putative oxidoreductase [Gemmatimonas aurantiaca T-27]|uniref:Putative oxidoreductase n=1 Tax=Gemmatimonas aurantiaca (strain DSM 14586 / JCM 11422 / NBRC 100505 / T-27) TaxID=379066 RepID=C1AA46_GEMAT|nr:thioredoxin domain-containing protein [Gemmatimonas aurantiaca]BAH39644.1 putative oxidoreductase [Gemmatimonas aurantiaca T-27]